MKTYAETYENELLKIALENTEVQELEIETVETVGTITPEWVKD